jgi:hypothetical protein
VVPQHKDGKLRAIVVACDRRSPALPEVPTLAESGLPGFSSDFMMVVVPAVAAFRQGLNESGFVDNQNVVINARAHRRRSRRAQSPAAAAADPEICI